MIESDEARELYERIVAGDYPSMEELKANPVVAQLDALSDYYKALYGNTADINTPERQALREELRAQFLSQGSARFEGLDDYGRSHYVYDGALILKDIISCWMPKRNSSKAAAWKEPM